MYMKAVLVRFFKSFNYDFLRKHHPKAEPEPWELIDDAWFPFVRVPLIRDVTTIVGANESGKSHLLDAIKKGLTGEQISRRDFCRYSQFFSVEEGQMRWPDLGFQFAGLSSADRQLLRDSTNIEVSDDLESFTIIRSQREALELWIPTPAGHAKHVISDPRKINESSLLPQVFEINSQVALPGSVPISWLLGGAPQRWRRTERSKLIRTVDKLEGVLATQEAAKSGAGNIFKSLSPFFKNAKPEVHRDSDASFELAKDLLFKVAKVDKAAIDDLSEALSREDEGLANGILQQINERLAAALNFPKWWVQDREFRLAVTARDDDLVFTISDRTHTEYSFSERSNGLRYFLSYYIQYLAHEPPAVGQEILLMDEPDTYLSSQGQQDLLKIFNSFADPDAGKLPIQVVYVTHSPFLIDRNHGERIRVLEKGTDDEGTRVVNDASKNHYEPLRSSFGAFVGETTFIGNCNLMVEGLADQVLLAGGSSYLRSIGLPRTTVFDLNRVTIVPAGSASHIPYLVYLARGRDIEQPAVIVLLDSDSAGIQAEKDLKRGGPKHKQLLKPEFVLTVSALEGEAELPAGRSLVEMEDLIPPGLAAAATQRYLHMVVGATESEASSVTGERILAEWTGKATLFDAIGAVVSKHAGADVHVDKVGFARSVVELTRLQKAERPRTVAAEDLERFRKNFSALLVRLTQMQRNAEREVGQERISRRVDRAVKAFLQDHPSSSKREDAMILLEDIEAVLDDSREGDEIRLQLQRLRRDHGLSQPSTGLVDEFSAFIEALRQVRYSPLNAVQEPVVEISSGHARSTSDGDLKEVIVGEISKASANGESAKS